MNEMIWMWGFCGECEDNCCNLVMGTWEIITYTILCIFCLLKHFHDKKLKFFTNLFLKSLWSQYGCILIYIYYFNKFIFIIFNFNLIYLIIYCWGTFYDFSGFLQSYMIQQSTFFPQHFLVHEISSTFTFLSLGEIWMCDTTALMSVII